MLSQRLRQLRKERSLTLQEVADHLGVTRASASKWETGLSHPSFKRLDALAKLYGVSTPELLSSPTCDLNAPSTNDSPPPTQPKQHSQPNQPNQPNETTHPGYPSPHGDLAPSGASRNLPVVYLDYTTPIEVLLERARRQAGFPNRLPVSEGAFFVALGGYMTAHFGLRGVPRDALLLVDPARPPHHGDLVLVRTKGLDYQVVAARHGGGRESGEGEEGDGDAGRGEGGLKFVSLGIKLAHLGPLPDVQPLGVVIEAVSALPLLGFALHQPSFSLA